MATLTARDVAILASLRQYRYLNVDQLHELFFDSRRRAQARTQWLREHHLLHRWAASDICSLHRLPSVFSASPRGAGVLAACLDEPSRPHVERARHARDHCFHMVHDLEANGFFVDLAAACSPLREVGLYHWVGEEDCRRRYRTAIAPDGWGRLLTPTGDILFFLEWDRGTESPARVAAKASSYLSYFADKEAADLNHVLFVAPGPAREESIRSIIDHLLPGGVTTCSFSVTHAELLANDGSIGAIWRRAEGDGDRISILNLPPRPRSLRPIADCIGKPDWWERRPGGGAGA